MTACAQLEAVGATRLLRVEGAVVLTTAVLVWAHAVDGSWLLFALLFFLPDLSMIGYVKGPRVGAIAYNLAHTYSAPALLASLAFVGVPASVWRLAIIWVAHIGFDRLMGYGLKHPTGFKHTHLSTRYVDGLPEFERTGRVSRTTSTRPG